ncbi:globin-like [Dermacentor variabilis]|uniref:globin-like n=1 Tax=Dermacentor variabilis TaxID=34621 RepID=UPI003F5BAFCF
MGHAFTKGTINPRTGMCPGDTRLLKQTWRKLCEHNRNYGVLILQSFFHKQPDTMHLFRHFRGKPLQSLPEDMFFRTHACAFGCQLTCMVDNSDDPDLLEALIRKNAEVHRHHLGVRPMHFRIMGKAVVDVLQTKNGKLMTADAVLAWDRLFSFIAIVTATVMEASKLTSDGGKKVQGAVNSSTPSKKVKSQRSASRSSSSYSAGSKSSANVGQSKLPSQPQSKRPSTTAVVPYIPPSESAASHKVTNVPPAKQGVHQSKSTVKKQPK